MTNGPWSEPRDIKRLERRRNCKREIIKEKKPRVCRVLETKKRKSESKKNLEIYDLQFHKV